RTVSDEQAPHGAAAGMRLAREPVLSRAGGSQLEVQKMNSTDLEVELNSPGTWTFEKPGLTRFVRDANGIAIMADETYYPWCPDSDADRHLSAAAPELLKLAKQDAASCASCGGTGRDPWNDPNGKRCADCTDVR